MAAAWHRAYIDKRGASNPECASCSVVDGGGVEPRPMLKKAYQASLSHVQIRRSAAASIPTRRSGLAPSQAPSTTQASDMGVCMVYEGLSSRLFRVTQNPCHLTWWSTRVNQLRCRLKAWVIRNHYRYPSPPPDSAIAREGNLWGESGAVWILDWSK